MNPPPAGPASKGYLVIGLRVLALLALVVLATWGSHVVRETLNLQVTPSNEQQVHRAIMLGMVAYVVLLTLPFVPGAEIGIALLTAFGAAIVPLVYVATVLAMSLAYTLGRLIPVTVLARLLSLFRLRRAAGMIERAAPLSRDARLRMLLEGAPPGFVALALRHRYVALALALNLPGNVVIGGGGGIMMLAGMSRIFAPVPTFVAIVIAVSPIPVAVALFGV